MVLQYPNSMPMVLKPEVDTLLKFSHDVKHVLQDLRGSDFGPCIPKHLKWDERRHFRIQKLRLSTIGKNIIVEHVTFGT